MLFLEIFLIAITLYWFCRMSFDCCLDFGWLQKILIEVWHLHHDHYYTLALVLDANIDLGGKDFHICQTLIWALEYAAVSWLWFDISYWMRYGYWSLIGLSLLALDLPFGFGLIIVKIICYPEFVTFAMSWWVHIQLWLKIMQS